jgi:uncharacterized membrane protein (UPF0127 family)
MFQPAGKSIAFNRTRQVVLAAEVVRADTHWSRLRGLVGTPASRFSAGQGLWLVPCRGIHTLAMGYPIDALYLDRGNVVVHLEQKLAPWRFAPVKLSAATVLEVPASTVADTQTQVGDQIEFQVAGEAKPQA